MSIRNLIPGLSSGTTSEINKRIACVPTDVSGSGVNLTLSNNNEPLTVFVSTAHAHTITLMPNPRDGQVVFVYDATGTASANNITVNGNGKNIRAAATLVMSTDNQSVRLLYSSTNTRWLY